MKAEEGNQFKQHRQVPNFQFISFNLMHRSSKSTCWLPAVLNDVSAFGVMVLRMVLVDLNILILVLIASF
jgi:hypothetical protein